MTWTVARRSSILRRCPALALARAGAFALANRQRSGRAGRGAGAAAPSVVGEIRTAGGQAVISRSLGILRGFDKAACFICTVDFARRCNGESSEISFCLGEI